MDTRFALLSLAESRDYDATAERLGVPRSLLMEHAGRAVAQAFRARWPGRPALLLCGPGDNGGDGFVAARILRANGAAARVLAMAPAGASEASGVARGAWTGPVAPLDDTTPHNGEAVVDALFGAGLSRPLEGVAAMWAQRSEGVDTLAVDVPSGVPGDGGAPAGAAFQAVETVTFVRKKPAHVLEPGRSRAGLVRVAEIGGPTLEEAKLSPRAFENHPRLWRDLLPFPNAGSHKHNRGKALVWAETASTRPSATLGAQRLAARAAQRAGAGWVSVACAAEDAPWFMEPASLVVRTELGALAALAQEHDAVAFGPGAGRGETVKERAIALARASKAIVLDADALTASADDPSALFSALPARCVLTPHGGEFARLFPAADRAGDKIARARAAAAEANAVVLLKGADTVIAAPDGRAIVNTHATPWLASAGTGDVLTGLIAGLLAQGLSPLEAAAAAAWMHGEAALAQGPGLIADDLASGLGAAVSRALEAD